MHKCPNCGEEGIEDWEIEEADIALCNNCQTFVKIILTVDKENNLELN